MANPMASVNNRISQAPITGQPTIRPEVNKGGPNFADSLRALDIKPSTIPQAEVGASQGLKFSNHAVDRMRMRGVAFSPDELGRIDSVVNKAAEKGAKETLVLTDKAALIVNPKNKTVITVMDSSQLKENVFTNIDSTVMV